LPADFLFEDQSTREPMREIKEISCYKSVVKNWTPKKRNGICVISDSQDIVISSEPVARVGLQYFAEYNSQHRVTEGKQQ
jgi:hypothetical protein